MKKNHIEKQEKKISGRGILMIGISLFILPVLILFGTYLLGGQQYYLVGVLMIAIMMFPFFLQFESRDPKVGEIVTLACMSGLAVVSRVALAPLPQIKPMASIVIVTGVCFGAESGFLAGALAVFLSNLYFGQGSWTPYQMFGMAMVGCVAGLLFGNGKWERRLFPICLYGGVSTLILYGGVVNLNAILIPGQTITPSYVVSVYLAALPFDLLHAGSTMAFLFLTYKPFMKILRRIRRKYGILSK